ncbi:MAG TPA: bacillithiol biosynthesis deacetylase BshB1 [Candidatus Angelobacter sp.]|nr:bacillithiol biosynthesis deacetylase BshB1 [Candidatus Angelobacter sp.]
MTELDLLAFGAHPDDVEIGMGGTLALHVKQGFKVGIVDLTQAELSSNGTVTIRQEEAEQAAKVLGLSVRQNLGFPDRGLLDPAAIVPVLVDMIRTYKPTLVFAPYEIDRHPDHGHCGRLVEEAVFSAGIHKYQGREERPAHRVSSFYSYFINGFHSPDFVVDITSVQDKKRESLMAYKSQFIKVEGGVETPLTSGYVESVESRDRLFGKEVGLAFAEGFKTKKPFVQRSLL